ncbi:hypothetical protein CF326_g1258 [Tilletia indica]|nr:hypothetical protein CF326_g1258 [Tilletia indica]
MVIGARIDHAGHNDPAGHENDIIQYTSLFRAVTQWVDANHDALVEPSKIVASTSDHECGGLPLGLERPKDKSEAGYMWYPDVVLSASHRVPGCRLSQIPFLRHPLSV